MTVPNFMSKALSSQDLCGPLTPRGIIRRKYSGADGVNLSNKIVSNFIDSI